MVLFDILVSLVVFCLCLSLANDCPPKKYMSSILHGCTPCPEKLSGCDDQGKDKQTCIDSCSPYYTTAVPLKPRTVSLNPSSTRMATFSGTHDGSTSTPALSTRSDGMSSSAITMPARTTESYERWKTSSSQSARYSSSQRKGSSISPTKPEKTIVPRNKGKTSGLTIGMAIAVGVIVVGFMVAGLVMYCRERNHARGHINLGAEQDQSGAALATVSQLTESYANLRSNEGEY